MAKGVRFISSSLSQLQKQYSAVNVERKYRNVTLTDTKELGNGEYYFDVVGNGQDVTLTPDKMEYLLVADCRVVETPEADANEVVLETNVDSIVSNVSRGVVSAKEAVSKLVKSVLRETDKSVKLKEDEDTTDSTKDNSNHLVGNYKVTNLQTGRTSDHTYDQAVGLFGREEFEKMLKGNAPDYIVNRAA